MLSSGSIGLIAFQKFGWCATDAILRSRRVVTFPQSFYICFKWPSRQLLNNAQSVVWSKILTEVLIQCFPKHEDGSWKIVQSCALMVPHMRKHETLLQKTTDLFGVTIVFFPVCFTTLWLTYYAGFAFTTDIVFLAFLVYLNFVKCRLWRRFSSEVEVFSYNILYVSLNFFNSTLNFIGLRWLQLASVYCLHCFRTLFIIYLYPPRDLFFQSIFEIF